MPVSLSTPDSQLHFHLGQYKRNRVPEVRRDSSEFVAALLARFLATHGPCIRRFAAHPWSAMVVVPSGKDSGEHPLETALRRWGWEERIIRPMRRGNGSLRRGQASDDAYQVVQDVAGMDLLVVDDTMTTGAHLQSAASALTLAGAEVVAAVPIGRYLDRSRGKDEVGDLLDRAQAKVFDFEECCLEHEGPIV